jgi:hypothetical protein
VGGSAAGEPSQSRAAKDTSGPWDAYRSSPPQGATPLAKRGLTDEEVGLTTNAPSTPLGDWRPAVEQYYQPDKNPPPPAKHATAKPLPRCNATHPANPDAPRPDIDDFGIRAYISNKPGVRTNGQVVR